jgi:hypothetical protein
MPYDYLISILYRLAIVFSVLIRHRSKKDRKYNDTKIEDTNEVIIRHRSKKDRKYNGKMIEDANGGIIRHRSKPYDYLIGILYHFVIVFSVL